MRFIHFTNADNLDEILYKGITPYDSKTNSYLGTEDQVKQEKICSTIDNSNEHLTEYVEWNPPCVYADMLFEDDKATYNGWLGVLWREDQNLSESKSTVGIVFELNPEKTIYIGQWGNPIVFPGKETKTIHTTREEYYHSKLYAQQVRTTISEFEQVLNSALQKLNSNCLVAQINSYDFVLGSWVDYEDIMETIRLGKVFHFYREKSVATLELEKELKVGERIHFEGKTTSFEMDVISIQKGHKGVSEARAGDEVGLEVPMRVRENDIAYNIIKEWKNPKNRKDIESIRYPWTGPGFEIRFPYSIPPSQILGYYLFGSKDQLDEAWYKKEMFK